MVGRGSPGEGHQPETGNIGAFLDWGLAKDLLLPIPRTRTLRCAPEIGPLSMSVSTRKQIEFWRPRGSTGILSRDNAGLSQRPTGQHPHYRKIAAWLQCHRGERAPRACSITTTSPLLSPPAKKLKVFVRAVRPDGKIDLRLDASGYKRVAALTDQIAQALEQERRQADVRRRQFARGHSAKVWCQQESVQASPRQALQEPAHLFSEPGNSVARQLFYAVNLPEQRENTRVLKVKTTCTCIVIDISVVEFNARVWGCLPKNHFATIATLHPKCQTQKNF